MLGTVEEVRHPLAGQHLGEGPRAAVGPARSRQRPRGLPEHLRGVAKRRKRDPPETVGKSVSGEGSGRSASRVFPV